MKSNGKRRIRSGEEFDHLFPKPTGKDHRVKGYADVEDTLKLIKRTVPETLWQTKAIAKVLKGKNLKDTCSNIWHFVYEHIQYKKMKMELNRYVVREGRGMKGLAEWTATATVNLSAPSFLTSVYRMYSA